MNKTLITQITECIENTFDIGGVNLSKKIIIYPCGDVGIQIINIMRIVYGLEPAIIIDNQKCKFSENIHEISYLKEVDTKEYVVILASTNTEIYDDLKACASSYISANRILELECMLFSDSSDYTKWKTEIGKHSYGPICIDHPWIKSIGAFCSFAKGVDVVTNHEFRYVTTHPIIYAGKNHENIEESYDDFESEPWFVGGVNPRADKVKKQRGAIIGNDVWLGKNVTITNSANIGNGVIAAAGAVITKDVPDYAIVAGIPARVIRYRYTPEQIEALNKIAWWDWSDDEIRVRYYR